MTLVKEDQVEWQHVYGWASLLIIGPRSGSVLYNDFVRVSFVMKFSNDNSSVEIWGIF